MPDNSDVPVSESKVSKFPFRFVGLILIAAAVLLHVRQSSEQRNRELGAAKVRQSAAAGVLGLGLRAVPDGASREPIFEPCSREVASNILACLSAAAPTRDAPPDGAKTYDLFLLLPDRARAFLRAQRAPGDDSAFVALRSVQRSGASPVELDCVPAVVEGLGAFFDELDTGEGGALRKTVELPNLEHWKSVSRDAPEFSLSPEERSSTASSLRAVIAKGVAAIGVSSGRSTPDSPVAMSLLVGQALSDAIATFANAEDVDNPSPTIDGRGCSAAIFATDKVRLALMVAIPDESPNDALVGFIETTDNGGPDGRPSATVSPPARVPGLGAVIAPALDAAGKVAGAAE